MWFSFFLCLSSLIHSGRRNLPQTLDPVFGYLWVKELGAADTSFGLHHPPCMHVIEIDKEV